MITARIEYNNSTHTWDLVITQQLATQQQAKLALSDLNQTIQELQQQNNNTNNKTYAEKQQHQNQEERIHNSNYIHYTQGFNCASQESHGCIGSSTRLD